MEFLSINNVALTVIGYPMSYLELLGVLFNLVCVILVARKHILTWPLGIVGAALFSYMFWQIQLYSDAILNGYFIITGFLGWWAWIKKPTYPGASFGHEQEYKFSGAPTIMAWAMITAIAAMMWGSFMKRAHTMLPELFTQPASYPFWDSAILMMSFSAQLLMVRKRTECWLYWIAIDVLAIALYWVKDIKFTSILYLIFLGIASYGLHHWISSSRKHIL